MTREEAIGYLKRADTTVGQKIKTRTAEALDIAIKVLEQEPKSEWEHDHEILKAYSDGANEVLDKITIEIEQVAEEESKFNIKGARGLKHALKIINKYKAEMEKSEK